VSTTPIVVPPAPAAGKPGVTKRRAVLIEVLSIVASVASGHLVAGLVSPLSSPFQAVADTMVRISPDWLVEIGKSLDFPSIGLPKGVADKVLLLVGIGVALVGLGVLAGLAAYRSRSLGRAVIVVLGLAGLAAVVFSPVFGLADVLAPLAALLVGLSVYFRLYNLAENVPAGPKVPDGGDPVELTRRKLIVSSAGVGAGAVAAGAVGQLLGAGSGPDVGALEAATSRLRAARPAPPIPAGADFAAQGSTTFITANKDFYRIDTALRIPVLNPRDYRLRLHGMVDREISLSYDDLLQRPLAERVITLCCVSNTVNGDLISNATFTGVSLRDLLLEAGVRPGADQIFATSSDGWTCGTPTDVVLEPDRGAMLALAMNGEPLPVEHGYPVRMVVPGLYGFVSATKWLTDLELTTFDRRRSYWIDRGWAVKAPVKTASRIDRPRGLDTVPAGRFTAAGIAWAQHRGISRVEVRVDGGPWQEAMLSTEVSRDTWRMWRAELMLAPGNHNIESRATDGTGAVQPEERVDPIPDGATGWPQILFTAH
jgi:DMSO/TMAO reductase YedYZ molybdopterin-dependent catalytic subunit